jgi:flavin-dependent dehydrogenase
MDEAVSSEPPGEQCDVIVVGGGPAGCTAASFLARKGWAVTLLEKDHYPRFHIGESLLPMNLPILQRLGILDSVAKIGVLKAGADFPAPTAQGYNVFRFERALDAEWPHAFQVRRDEFDELLLECATASGVRTLPGHQVSSFSSNDSTITVEGSTDTGTPFRFTGRYLVDASGRNTLIGKQLRIKRRSRVHQSAALFAHFRGVTRRQGGDSGNISIYRFEHGWAWLIPLRDGITSVGVVCWPEYLKNRRSGNRDFLLQTIQSIPSLQQRMEDAEMVGNLHVTGNYSYRCSRSSGTRWIMAGDSYAFVDPIFSSGVYLAMHAAEHAAAVVDGSLREPGTERNLQRDYAREIRRGLKTLSWFIFRFTSPAMTSLFAAPRNDLKLEQAMISMLAGDVFRDNGVAWRLRLFKLIYFATALGQWSPQVRSYLMRRRQTRAAFSGGTTSQDET